MMNEKSVPPFSRKALGVVFFCIYIGSLSLSNLSDKLAFSPYHLQDKCFVISTSILVIMFFPHVEWEEGF